MSAPAAVLLVDDEPRVLDALEALLAMEHEVFRADRPETALELLRTKDQPTPTAVTAEGSAYAIWATPKLFNPNWELLLRHDETKPVKGTDQKRKRDIAGIAYWVPNLQKVTAAVMLDYDSLRQSGYTPARPRDTRYALKMFINF